MSSTVERWHAEFQAAWIYDQLAVLEQDERRRTLWRELAVAAGEQAGLLAQDLAREGRARPDFHPSWRARTAVACARRFGIRTARPLLAALKVRGLSVFSAAAPDVHAMPHDASEIGARHRRAGTGGQLRAAVFGASDGLVSSACLVFGVAGAGASRELVLTTGIAGLLAGAFSMAAGEYVSMRSQRELYEAQIAEERAELERYPEEEAEELALIYAARGVPLEDARRLARALIRDPELMLETLSREELGLDPSSLGSPWSAAGASFAAFALGALVPLGAFALPALPTPELISAACTGLGLIAVGVAVALFSGRPAWLGGLRMLAIGAGVGVVTHLVGRWIGQGSPL